MKKLIFCVLMLIGTQSHALSVHDPINAMINLLNKMENQISKVQQKAANHQLVLQAKRQFETIQALKMQFLTMQQQLNSMQGSGGYGQYLEGPFKALDPRYTPKTLEELLWLMRDVGKGTGPASQQLNDFLKDNPYYQGSYKPSFSNDILEGDRRGIRDNSAAAAVYSQETYQSAQESYDTISSLQKKIDKADTLKNALDLNNRIMTELSYMFAISMRNDSVTNRLGAKEAQQKVNAETRARNFNQYRPKRYEVVK